MNHRHLLPTEIDLLLDDEEGFGVAPLKAHLLACADCATRFEEARFVTDALEELPHFAPSHDFASKVMARVPVFVPWHVAARDSLARYVPRSRPMRLLVGGVAASAAAMLTAMIVFIASRGDLLVFASGVAGARLRELGTTLVRDLLASLLGPASLALVAQRGLVGVAMLGVAIIAAAALATYGFRAAAVASVRRRA